ncbi:MAG: hypothetical protein SGJ27_06380 [Candidatus Melainabacteria bacterium]|nr:hypothetical protein [Candidatus Melainabacteria bacterium]
MYEKLNLLAKSIVAKFATQPETDEAFAVDTINRLSQISNRARPVALEEEEVHPDGYISGRLKRLEIPDDGPERPITHWCADTGRYLRQNIRQGEQLCGAEKSFEIDPISKLP